MDLPGQLHSALGSAYRVEREAIRDHVREALARLTAEPTEPRGTR
jgi:hypothetical protein